MFDVENVPIELLLLSGSRLAMGRIFLGAGGAGNFSIALLANALESGVIARLIGINVTGGNQAILLGPTQNTAAQGGTRAFADTRVFGEGTALQMQGSNNNLVAGSTFYSIPTLSNGEVRWEPPGGIAVITPGGAFSVSASVANISITVSYLWIERQAQPSELNL